MTDQMPELWIGTSWKMNKTLREAMDFAERLLATDSERDRRIQRFVIPSFTTVREVKARLAAASVKVGAQNMHWADAGAWTGEVSPLQLVDCQLDIVELGHSERRTHFNETNETVGRKVAAAVQHQLTPLICIGETLADKESGKADAVLTDEVSSALGQLTEQQKTAEILLAYEPVWAIGDGGIPAGSEYANEKQQLIKQVAGEILGKQPRCLYGGSVNPGNCEELIQCEYIDGLFIGRSAWDVEGYLDILKRCSAKL